MEKLKLSIDFLELNSCLKPCFVPAIRCKSLPQPPAQLLSCGLSAAVGARFWKAVQSPALMMETPFKNQWQTAKSATTNYLCACYNSYNETI